MTLSPEKSNRVATVGCAYRVVPAVALTESGVAQGLVAEAAGRSAGCVSTRAYAPAG